MRRGDVADTGDGVSPQAAPETAALTQAAPTGDGGAGGGKAAGGTAPWRRRAASTIFHAHQEKNTQQVSRGAE
jgi:hypothetical protein